VLHKAPGLIQFSGGLFQGQEHGVKAELAPVLVCNGINVLLCPLKGQSDVSFDVFGVES
jgi:hypothetical protein